MFPFLDIISSSIYLNNTEKNNSTDTIIVWILLINELESPICGSKCKYSSVIEEAKNTRNLDDEQVFNLLADVCRNSDAHYESAIGLVLKS